jgi:hypothetical protein
MNKHIIAFLVGTVLPGMTVLAQTKDAGVERELKGFFTNFIPEGLSTHDSYALKSYSIDTKNKTIRMAVSTAFAYQPFTPERLERIRTHISHVLPSPYDTYKLSITVDGVNVENLIPNVLRTKPSDSLFWGKIAYDGEPWVNCTSKPYRVASGLYNKHLTVWASHGKFYKNEKRRWEWQRPHLFTTTEDLLSPTFVYPFLIPMLQNAGAVVYSPRERDWQKREVIVDNDSCTAGIYSDASAKYAWEQLEGIEGFGYRHSTPYIEGENPFRAGTVRGIHATSSARNKTEAHWIPEIEEEGDYAVYVSYATLPNSVPDAHYTVVHQGVATHFTVNQQMGGSTWVYLGTFHFGKGRGHDNSVMLSNYSDHRGMVTADAVRFGGGMGNIARGPLSTEATTSGLARCFEGARYACQWAGMPYSVYSSKGGDNDYGDDINARSLSENYLARGSVFVPADSSSGLRVPIELSLALHTDAGVTHDGSFLGSLSIHTTDFNGGRFDSKLPRSVSRDFCDEMLTGLQNDLTQLYGNWSRRQIWNRNYSETRLPNVPSAILELLSHQNFKDMRYAHDPNFKFRAARSVYHSILKYVNDMHQTDFVVQPLPVSHFAAILQEEGKARLSWKPQTDVLYKSAVPTSYILYTRVGNGGYDNGVVIRGTETTVNIQPDILYSFKVSALNAGGESFPSEELVVCQSSIDKAPSMLIVNGFQRVCGPAVVQTSTEWGFDLNEDPGVPYMKSIGYAGKQTCFDASANGKEGVNGLGYTDGSLEGGIYVGNTFDYPRLHSEGIGRRKGVSISSCSKDAFQEMDILELKEYRLMDLILGLERHTDWQLGNYKSFTPEMQSRISGFVNQGGNILVSGAYVGSDMQTADECDFTERTLKYRWGGAIESDSIIGVTGMNTEVTIPRTLNEHFYAVAHPDVLVPVSNASFTTLTYGDMQSAAVAYDGKDYKAFVMGFPLESIEQKDKRNEIMGAILDFLLK